MCVCVCDHFRRRIESSKNSVRGVGGIGNIKRRKLQILIMTQQETFMILQIQIKMRLW